MIVLGLVLAAAPACALEWGSIGLIDGAPVRTVLPPDAIRAIDEPAFLTGAAAERQMARDEPVLGVRLGPVARVIDRRGWYASRRSSTTRPST